MSTPESTPGAACGEAASRSEPWWLVLRSGLVLLALLLVGLTGCDIATAIAPTTTGAPPGGTPSGAVQPAPASSADGSGTIGADWDGAAAATIPSTNGLGMIVALGGAALMVTSGGALWRRRRLGLTADRPADGAALRNDVRERHEHGPPQGSPSGSS